MGLVNYAYAGGSGAVPVAGGGVPGSQLAPSGSAPVVGGGMPWEPPAPKPAPGRCHHKRDDLTFCGRYPKKGEKFCPLHKRSDEALDFLNEAVENLE